MSTLTVVLAPAGLLSAVRDTLQDWSGAGLIDRFLWLEPSMITGGGIAALSGEGIAALSVEAGRLDGETLQALAGRERFDRIRLAVLVPALHDAPLVTSTIEQHVAQFLESSFGGTPVTRIRAIISRVGEVARHSALVVGGWHNVVLSPEDSTGPGVGISQLRATRDLAELGVPAAASLAGLLALWTGIETSVLDGEQLLPGTQVRLSRSYFRRLATAQLERDLRHAVFSTERGLPLPTQFGASTAYIEDSALATATMADQLWNRHAGVLKGARETAPPSPFTRIGALEALRLFFTFLGAALRGAPAAWAAALVNRVSARAASAVHSLVFGSEPSAYAVVVNGVTAEGLPASWSDLTEAATTLDRALDVDPTMLREHAVHADMSALWKDFASAAMTLADAGERVVGLTPVQIGTALGVLRNAGLAVPAHDQSFSGVPPHLAASVGMGEVAPYDVLGAFALEERLRAVADQPSLGVAASAALHALGQWKAEHFDSFAARVGNRVGDSLYSTAAEIRSLLEQIKQAASADDLLAEIAARQKRLALVLRVLAIVVVLALALTGVLYAVKQITMTTLIVVLGGMLLAWLLGSLLTFLRGQRDLFALINARRAVMSNEQLARRNLRHALTDAQRLGDCYGQFLAWSKILGTVLTAPFGRFVDTDDAPERQITGLPLAVGLGTAVAEPSVIAAAANEIRRDIFSVGWLTTSWEMAVANAYQQVGPLGVDLRADPQSIFRSQSTEAGNVLALWGDALLADGVDRSIADDHWTRILIALEGTRSALGDSLLAQVADSRLDPPELVGHDTFMGEVDAVSQNGPGRMDDGLVSDGARVRGVAVVDQSFTQRSRSGLGRTVSLTQLTAGFAGYELLAAAGVYVYGFDDDPSPDEHGEVPVPELFNGIPF